MIGRIENDEEWSNSFDLLALYSDGYRKRKIVELKEIPITYYKYIINNKIVGIIGFKKYDKEIIHLTVHPEYRNQHIALNLINFVLDNLSDKAYLAVRTNNITMNNLITKHFKYEIVNIKHNILNEELYYYQISKK